jgi:predicted secreted protein
MGSWHGWANFNTQSVQTLSFSRFVASRSNAKHDGWHEFSEFDEKSSDFVELFIYL